MIQQPSNLAQQRAAWRVTNGIAERTTPCFRLTNAAVPKLYVFDVIGGFDGDSAEFVQTVHGLNAKAIDLHVNSPGGHVYDAMAMYEALKTHPAAVNVHIDGLAASAASFLAQAGDSIDISRGGRMMIHDAQVAAWGSPADLREAADVADAVSNDIAGIYAGRAGGKPAAWRSAMSKTTWYSASEAVDAHLADRVAGSNDGPDNRTRLIQARHRATLGGVK
jgi:ATP-dependent protease ClpP protease subunit